MVHLRFIGITAGIAFFLALITGLFSGAGFGLVFLRSFLTGILFGGLAFVLRWIIDRYLPGLLNTETKQSEKRPGTVSEDSDEEFSDEEELGIPELDGENNVDIVLEEENPHISRAESPEEFVEEMENVSESDEEEPEDSGEIVIPAEAVSEAEDVGDDLPNLDQFSSSFSGVENEFMESEKDFISGDGKAAKQDNVDIMGSEHSTEELAKAVKTLLVKEEKG